MLHPLRAGVLKVNLNSFNMAPALIRADAAAALNMPSDRGRCYGLPCILLECHVAIGQEPEERRASRESFFITVTD